MTLNVVWSLWQMGCSMYFRNYWSAGIFPHNQLSALTENGVKKRKCPEKRRARGQRRMARLLQGDRKTSMLQPRYTDEHLWAQSLLILERENHTWCHSHQVKTGNSGYHSHRITKIFTTIQTGRGVLMWEIFSLRVGPHSTVCRIVPAEHCLKPTCHSLHEEKTYALASHIIRHTCSTAD